MWPSYINKSLPDRKVVLLEKGRLYAAETGKALLFDGKEDLCNRLFNENLIAFTESISDGSAFPFLPDFVADDRAQVLCTKHGTAKSVHIRRGNGTRWIGTGSPWGYREIDIEFCKLLQEFFEYMGGGYHPTPTGVGLMLMRLSWEQYNLKRHTNINGFAEEFIRKNLVGGRVDTPGLGNFYERAGMWDERLAYDAEWGNPKPTGSVSMFSSGKVDKYDDWFAECDIRIGTELPLGPFPCRLFSNDHTVSYPTLPGTYKATLWKVQAEDAVNAGCYVHPGRGIGWTQVTSDTLPWARDMYELCANAPSPEIAELGKRSTVSPVGVHGSQGLRYHLVTEKQLGSRNAVPLCGEGVPRPYFVVSEQEHNSEMMLHWYSRTLAGAASVLYNFALPFAERGTLIATNYDSVMSVEIDENGRYIKRHSVEGAFAKPGTWLYELITNLKVLRSRTFDCDQFSVHPGVRRQNVR